MMMNTRKDVKQLLRRAERAGFEIHRNRKHIKVICPWGERIFGVSRTPSDPLALTRIRADFRRCGLE